VKFHLDQKCETLIFSVEEPEGVRTYIYNDQEKYVVVLEPLRDQSAYYSLTAYNLIGRDAARNKMLKKYKKRRLEKVY